MKKTFKKSLSILMSVVLICSMAFSLQITPVMAEDAGITDEISFYENVSEAEFAEDDTITVLIEFDYPENDYDIRETNSLESSQEQLRLLRASNRAYYTENNQEFIDDLDIEYPNMDVSAYSPYVFVTFDTWDEYADARDDLIELSENSKVKRVFAEETPVMEDAAVNVNTSNSSINVSMDDAKKLIGVKDENGRNTSTASGDGIRIGILESGHALKEHREDPTVEGSPILYYEAENFPDGTIKGVRDYDDVLYHHHAEKVASIIGSVYDGIAPNAEFYFAGSFSNEAIEWLISDEVNVNIINMSASIGDSRNGYYLGYDAYTDYISRMNLVLFVISAGNLGQSSGNITSPGLGLNVLTVGAIDANKHISWLSSYLTSDDFSRKPTFVAPGENIIVANCNNTPSYKSGTSFSAPMVTGMAALLMDEFENYILYPELIAAALINSCESLPGQTEMWNTYAGAGLVNYVNARNILLNGRYDTASIISTQSNTQILLECSIDLSTNENTITYCMFDLIKPNVYNIYSNNPQIGEEQEIDATITYYRVEIYNSSGISIHTGTSVNNIIVGKVCDLTPGPYYIRVYMNGAKNSNDTEYLALAYRKSLHEHSYTCDYGNPTRLGHKAYCSCGNSILEPHVYEPYYGGQRCVICNYITN